MPHPGTQLRQALADRRGLLVPGAGNALAARVIENLGFEAVYLSGAGLTNNFYGMPDLGFVGLEDIARHTAAIRDAVALPLIVDADTGFGNALNVRHTVRTLERAGANAIQLEDQVSPKKCGHFAGKAVIATAEMVGKVKAAVDAAMKDPATTTHLKEIGIKPVGGTRASFTKFVSDERTRLGSVVKATGMKDE